MYRDRGRAIDLIEASPTTQADLGTGISAALLRQVARGELPPTMRLHRTGRILAFGRRDRLAPNYRRAVAIARELGFQPIERMAGGRAAVFHEQTLAFSIATPTRGLGSGTEERFREMAGFVRDALAGLGVDARVGEVSGEYCPGRWSVNSGGRLKLAGIGQRTISGGAHVGGVLVVGGAGLIRDALIPIYRELGLEWDPATAGSVADAIGPDAPGSDELIRTVAEALVAEVARRHELVRAEIGEPTLELAEELRDWHAVPA